MDDERPIGLRARRPGVAGDLGADRREPRFVLIHARGAVGAEAAQLPANPFADGLHQSPASATAPGVTSSSWSGSAGSIAASVAVMSAWPATRTRSARSSR